MKKIITLLTLIGLAYAAVYSKQANADEIDLQLNAGKCESWYYSVCDQPYVIHAAISYIKPISDSLFVNARADHISHPEGADLRGPSSDQTGRINIYSIGFIYKFNF